MLLGVSRQQITVVALAALRGFRASNGIVWYEEAGQSTMESLTARHWEANDD